jgi:hypothetical protein
LAYAIEYWSVRGTKSINFQMIDSKVLNNLRTIEGWSSDWWRLSFSASGSFLARNSEFTRMETVNFDYNMILETGPSENENQQEIRFDNCKLNYFMDSDEQGFSNKQISITNPNAILFTTNSVITGGSETIEATNWPDRR